MGPLFVLMGLYMIKAGPLPGQTRTLHWQLGGAAIAVGVIVVAVGLVAPTPPV